jgi:hypothetical protein
MHVSHSKQLWHWHESRVKAVLQGGIHFPGIHLHGLVGSRKKCVGK